MPHDARRGFGEATGRGVSIVNDGQCRSTRTLSQSSQQIRHRGVQTPRDYLQCNESDLALAALNIRQVPSIHVQVYCQIGLRVTLFFAELHDPLTQPYQQGMFAS
jgi:hypothetical protein